MRRPTTCITLVLVAFHALSTTTAILRSRTWPTTVSNPDCDICQEAFSQGHPVTGDCHLTFSGEVECPCVKGAVHPGPNHLKTCEQHPCNWSGTPVCDPATSSCVALTGLAFRCDCHSGFVPLSVLQRTMCVREIDHCSLGTDDCDKTKSNCVYKPPDRYYCTPKRTLKALAQVKDTATNPCEQLTDTCDKRSTQCVSTAPGKFECQCLGGYTRDPNAEDTNSCTPLATDTTPCKAPGNKCDLSTSVCTELGPDSYTCSCLFGFEKVDEFRCQAYDLCTAGEHKCDMKTTNCMSYRGGYTCPCKFGYTFQDAYSCSEVNICYTKDNTCDITTTQCIFIGPGDFACQCLPGYERKNDSTDYQACSAINHCTDTTNKCDLTTTVCNFEAPGLYTCQCQEGYKRLDQYSCSINDPCKDNSDKCDTVTTTCQLSFPDDYICACKKGFERKSNEVEDKHHCTDIDECADTSPPCDSKTSTCRNTSGSYQCDCLPGFRHPTPDEMTEDNKDLNQVCIDVDECTELDQNPCQAIFEKETEVGLSPISVTGKDGCVNLPGSYSCACSDGFDHGDNNDPTQCFDINECAQGADECDQDTTSCKNTRGSYRCPCRWGYKPTPEPSTTDIPSPSMSETVTHNSVTRHATLLGGVSCEDINECEEGLQGDPDNTVCDPERSVCSNTFGGYSCNCYQGFYQADKSLIEDLLRDGCKSTTTPCCIDIDECSEKETTIHNCSDICLSGLVEFPLNYTCDCNKQRYFVDDQERKCDNCGYEEWGSWGPCSVSCGSGLYTRTRKVKEGLGDTSPLCANPEYTVMTKACVMPPCDDTKECVLSGWSEWTPCTLTNGNPIQTRFRVIQAGESHCASYSLEESQPCSLQEKETPLEISWTHIGLACGGITAVLGTLTFCAYHIHQRRNAPVYIY